MVEIVDNIVIGAGPAGLTAAIYLARFNLATRIFDHGTSRCAIIPRTRNHAGYPGGIAGIELLRRMRQQAAEFGARVTTEQVLSIRRADDGTFLIATRHEAVATRTVLLATGVVNHRPRISESDHDAALSRGLLRYCPVCDGYEVNDSNVGVIGTGAHGCNEAVFLRMHTKTITLIAPDRPHDLSAEEHRRLSECGIGLVDGPCGELQIEKHSILAPTPEGTMRFDTIYPA